MSGAWPSGIGRLILAETDSTNAEAARRARADQGDNWIMAHAQSSARGRRGRAWSMGAGNFAASLLCRPDCAMADMAKFSFVAALALHDTLVGVGVDPAELHLKWPNDVLLSGRKLSGILLETVETAAGPGLIVGIGVNLAAAPDAADLEARAHAPITLAEHGITIGPEQFLDQLAPAFAARQGMFLGDGFPPIRAAWLSRAKGVGQEITARLPHATHIGIFEDVDDDGALILSTGKGRLVLPAADVYF